MTFINRISHSLAAVILSMSLAAPAAGKTAIDSPPWPQVDFAGQAASADARYAASRVLSASDHQGLPFVIVDKKDARIFVFGPDGQLRGASAALLGLASGDHSIPGIGARELSRILPAERTTPAGRFLSQPGRNLQGEEVVWVKHSEGLAIHRLRPGNSLEQRAQRLASSTTDDNRISLGCVVVPVAFYQSVVAPVLGKNFSVVYVLPETFPVQALFDALD